jgi:hypothetical protein
MQPNLPFKPFLIIKEIQFEFFARKIIKVISNSYTRGQFQLWKKYDKLVQPITSANFIE